MRDKVAILEYVNNLSFQEINRLKKALKEQSLKRKTNSYFKEQNKLRQKFYK